jgi:hypothetical protein
MQVKDYRLTAPNGRHIRTATMIVLADGKEVRFTERMSKAQAIRQLQLDTYHQHLAVARSMGLDTLRAFHASTPRP